MKIHLQQGDITKLKVDALVNAANNTLLGGGGVDGAIHQAAGPELLSACKEIIDKIGSCATGEAVITKGFQLEARYVIHTVGPIWHGGDKREPNLLASCYWKSLELAAYKELRSIAFPNISTGIYQFPKELAAEVAIDTVSEWIKAEPDTSLKDIYFICYDEENFQIYEEKLKESQLYDL